jgi:hypothetical protein
MKNPQIRFHTTRCVLKPIEHQLHHVALTVEGRRSVGKDEELHEKSML